MQYSALSARLLQSRALKAIKKWLVTKLKFIFKHPVKTLIWLVKAYISLMLFTFLTVFFLSSFVYAQTTSIYDQTYYHPPIPNDSCMKDGIGMIGWLHNWVDDQRTALVNNPNNDPNMFYKNFRYTNGPYETYNQNGCLGFVYAEIEQHRYLEDGTTAFVRKSYFNNYNVPGQKITVDSCTNHPEGATILKFYGEEVRCFKPEDLAANDTCDTLDPAFGEEILLPDPNRQCYHLADDSACPITSDFSVSDGENTYASYSLDIYATPGSCYALAPQDQEPPFDPPQQGEYCVDIGAGIVACKENESQMCPNGNCQEGCGTYKFGDESEFVCLAADLDDDSLPDYADPDIDGDGIRNEEDLDWDGDGLNDPDYSSGRPGTAGGIPVTGGDSGNGDGGGGTYNVTVDNSDVVAELQDIESNLTTNKTVDYTIPQDIQDMGQGNDYSVKNYGTVVEDAVTQMSDAPVFSAVETFFEVTLSGTCPVYSGHIDYINTTIVFDHLCKEPMTSIWPYIQAVIILAFSVLAFRVAIL